MKTFKRLLALVLVACISFCMFGCNKKTDNETGITGSDNTSKKKSGLTLPYSREDGLNPFTAISLVNEPLMPLLYEGLYSVDENYGPVETIAAETAVNGRDASVRLSSSAEFNDGTSITSSDVIYSFNLAKKSSYYASALTGIKAVKANGEDNLVFTLTEPNTFISSVLTFPVVKSGTADKKDDIPVGSGRYEYTSNAQGGTLKRSENYDHDKYSNKKINLLNVTASDSLLYSLAIGNISALFDDISDGVIERVSVSMAQVPLNNLVFVSFKNKGAMADVDTRKAINTLLDKDKIISMGMDGYAEKSDLPFNPDWYASDSVEVPKMGKKKARKIAEEKLSGTAINIVTCSDDVYKVNTAKAVANQLNALGAICTVNELDRGAYLKAVSAGWYDIYIGEMKLTNDMNISSLISQKPLRDAYGNMLSGDMAVDAFVNAFYEEMPFVTVGFRNGIVVYERNMSIDIKPLPQNPLSNIYEW